ncbi:MAG: glycoside/pentoside/hexuronide:cation symporter, family, partial [Pseudomonadota bacterium]|nr:glycoside/pentoside/hexuronide:cation symporter, family [Pseudomonadota bacterium]
LLGAGDGWQYACVCLLSGLALGADLALPPALLADVIPPQQRGATGSYFGYWSLLAKLSLALAAGLALPLLALLDYQPGGSSGLAALSWVYALLPCGLKCLAAALLLASRRQLQIREEA